MRAVKWLVLSGILSAAGSAQAVSLPFSNVFAFGDSLTDAGNARLGSAANNLPEQASPALGYADGRFSNGDNFVDDLSKAATGVPTTASFIGGRNFSVGGADAAANADASPDFLAQLAAFSLSGLHFDSKSLVVVTFGGNDIRDVVKNTGMVDFTPTLTALSQGLALLTAAGAKNIVVTGLPDIGALPITHVVALQEGDPDIVSVATKRSNALNSAFADIAKSVATASGDNVQFFDLLGFEQDLLADPTAFGLPALLNSTSYCQAGGVAALVAECQGYLYFDPIHPTKQIHLAIADAIGSQLLRTAVPEASTWSMMILGFGLVGAAGRRRRLRVRFG